MPIYTIDFIDLTSKKSYEYIAKEEEKFMKAIYEIELSEQSKILEKVTTKVNTLMSNYFSDPMTLLHYQGKIYENKLQEIVNIL
jgi:hypothetical protein